MMQRRLMVTTAADDLSLLTIEELRMAAGVTGSSQDAALQSKELQVAAMIATVCNVAVGEGAQPTLKRETLSETFWRVECNRLALSRRHEVEIASLTVDGEVLADTNFVVDPESGLIVRFCDDCPIGWRARKIEIVYEAGFEEIPDDLRSVATDLFRLSWLESSRDPYVKGTQIETTDIEIVRTDYWAGSLPSQSSVSSWPQSAIDAAARFRNVGLR